ncbi:helix-turn-helix domain-containing protein [Candidatus Bathyarchaeota archaeon]|nr:helix-turn-helix domain-containing protein [Candidatus Bathyarchaeota archaeon]
MGEMDFYDRGILTILRDGKPRTFQQILSEAGFSHNTLRKHLDELVYQGLVTRLKRSRKGPGRPLLTYRIQREAERAVSAVLDPSMGLVVVSFEALSRFCKREKGGFCKEIKDHCTPVSCPQIIK